MSYEGSICEIEDFPKCDIPVWILGKQYSTEKQLEEIRSDVRTRIWLTYRRNFPQISDTTFTSDKGWGCMLRCGQMVLAESLIRFHLGREWRWCPEEGDGTYLRIVALFEDDRKQPFSIHQMAQLGVSEGKKVGQWYGPNTVAHVLKKLTTFDHWNNIIVNVVMDNVFIKDEIRLSSLDPNDKSFRPLLLFIPLRLGVSEINPIYMSGLKKCLKMPQSLGIIGGKPNHALYFVGFMGEEVVYLDPHTTQDSGVLGDKKTDEEKQLDLTFHCAHAQRMPLEYLDPSLALCFFCSSEKDFGDLCNRLQQEIIDTETSPLLEIYNTRPSYLVDLDDLGPSGIDLEDHHLDSEDDEEFEVLE
ncbi:UNVERIFIED_CONTAM: hypothetical protein GTU68_057165 [Idotea baltica]|nr:hypothetical protein [Idotea baltica]